MPKELTHWIIADTAVARLPVDSPVRGMLVCHRHLFLAGAVLPDTLLHLLHGPHGKTSRGLAHHFHDPSQDSYQPLVRAERSFPQGLPAPLLSCLLGVICHMQADIAVHPYVFGVTGKTDIGAHYALETGLDLHLLNKGAIPPARLMAELVHAKTEKTLIEAMGMLFDPAGELPAEALQQALSLHCRFQGMYDRTRWKVAAAVLGALLGSPFREQRHLFYPVNKEKAGADAVREWAHPVTGETRNESVEHLTEEAARQTAAILQRYEEEGSLAAALNVPGHNLLTGMFGVRQCHMRDAGLRPA